MDEFFPVYTTTDNTMQKNLFIRLRFLSCVLIHKRKNISTKLNFHTPIDVV